MPTTVVGFRLGCDARSRQTTIVLTESGVLHRSNGPLGSTPKPGRPDAPASVDPHPVPRQAAKLRKLHAELTGAGFSRVLVPPGCVRLETDEHPLHAKPYGGNAPRPHPEPVEEFVGLASTCSMPLDEALRAFYSAVGVPSEPRHAFPVVVAAALRPPLPPRVERALRALARGAALASPSRRGVRWRVTAGGVRLHVGSAGEALTRQEVADLQAALSAWLHLNPRATVPGSASPGLRRGRDERRAAGEPVGPLA
ncbi:hypothetical protein ACFV7Q_22945 [Streptomyces sp. NPDC059851]|uniref:hypothetical protein n=1 Tax=Streptomyces sp. NPDC059851 TaxID=3346971 RepID=UPI003648E9D2